MPSAPDTDQPNRSSVFFDGMRAAWLSVFTLVLVGTYVGIAALARDYGFSLPWLMVSTALIWAGPAQVILISALGTGTAPLAVALAVGLSGVRLLPMVVALLPLLRQPHTRLRDLLTPAHFTAASMWVESLRLLPAMPRQRRLAFCNGLSIGYMISGQVGCLVGFYLAASLPRLLTAALLFLTPMSFLVSTVRNSRTLVDRLALGLGLVVGPVLAYSQVALDLLWTGLIAGSVAYAVHWLRRGRQ
jgi:predicted branched-subunit amino acid permease